MMTLSMLALNASFSMRINKSGLLPELSQINTYGRDYMEATCRADADQPEQH